MRNQLIAKEARLQNHAQKRHGKKKHRNDNGRPKQNSVNPAPRAVDGA